MKYVDEYRNGREVKKLAAVINAIATRPSYKIMEVCGTHTNSIHRFGLKSLLSRSIELISGPGCPVCVTSDSYLSNAIKLLKNNDVIIATYPDMLRVPAGGSSLEVARSMGADVRPVDSSLQALDFAKKYPNKEVVFLAVGFETTAPGTAIVLKEAKRNKVMNFSVYCGHKTIPEALLSLASDKNLCLDGFLLPGHVSAVIGQDGYRAVYKKVGLSSVIAGFEPLDILFAVYKIINSVNNNKPILENEYGRIVKKAGNLAARELLDEVFLRCDSVWRGLGIIKKSGFAIKKTYRYFDAEDKFRLKAEEPDNMAKRGCRCSDVLKGKITPKECFYFNHGCSPQKPKGPCMVSREGTCRTYYEYK